MQKVLKKKLRAQVDQKGAKGAKVLKEKPRRPVNNKRPSKRLSNRRPITNSTADGLYHNADGTKDFANGGKVHGVNVF